jgi:hypothetical protein
MPYFLMFVGLITLVLIPEYSGFIHFAIQGIVGLGIFALGAAALINEPTTTR